MSIFSRSVVATAVALLAATPTFGQSDATCIAYMEADAAYEPARREHKSALAAAIKSTASAKAAWKAWHYAKAVHQVRLRNAADPNYPYPNEPDLTDHASARRDMEIALTKARAASAASRKAWDNFAAIAEATEPARKKRNWAHSGAYKGPVSSNDDVMNKLLRADRERCRQRLEWQLEGDSDGTRETRQD